MPSKQEVDAILSEPVCIIGAGPTGLITAHTLLQDGFKNVQIFTKDEDVGGVWSKKRVYPGLVINNVHGQFNFSPLPMPAGTRYDERLTGDEISAYMEVFAQMYVKDKIQFGVEVLNLRHVIEGEKSQWVVKLLHKKTGLQEEKVFRRVVLCSGGCSTPTMPSDISPSVAESAGFSGLVFHTSDFKEKIDPVLQVVGPKGSGGGADGYAGSVVIVGGGRSAQDIATYLAKAGRQVTMIFGKADAFVAGPSPMPPWLRKSRRFFHTTWIGTAIVQLIWSIFISLSFKMVKLPSNSPLRNTYSFFWDIRATDEGVPDSDGFHATVNAGKIELVSPARVTGYYGGLSSGQGGQHPEGGVLVRRDGQSGPEAESQLRASVVILATGYRSSWDDLFDASTALEVGIAQEAYIPQNKFNHEWDHYRTLANPPPLQPEAQKWISPIYRGIVPAKNILRRDLAINGASFSAGNMQIWPQAIDELLEDMRVPSGSLRTGGNWLTWPFAVLDMKQFGTLSEERRNLRQAA
ncbi:FAD/NAD(P)-binding domain-containing protein [Pluteus cervinus]|uniref:FAD/NAD(P)-binding domain-containing protein n=1 Tax=Pluteus cervinus TaxID=181527 RepID=A0ACD3ABB4_9AGAR|nr:FAD/NAD(P)-binding domain-containing protein [Pluteus cervinus]